MISAEASLQRPWQCRYYAHQPRLRSGRLLQGCCGVKHHWLRAEMARLRPSSRFFSVVWNGARRANKPQRGFHVLSEGFSPQRDGVS